MKTTKKLLALVLALGMTAGFAACGDDKGGNSSVDTGTAKGEQVTLEEWTVAVTNTFAADNVTINTFSEYVDEADGFIVTANGVIKIADGVMNESMSYTETYDGMTGSYTDETYILKQDGTYYEWYNDSIDTLEWQCSEYRNSEYSPTVQGVVFSEEWTAEEIVAMYGDLEFDASTGEYSLFVEAEYDPFMMKVKIVNDKFYTLTTRMASEYEDTSSVWYSERKYVFVDYGTTTIDSLPGEEEEGGSNSENGGNPIAGAGQEVDQSGWNAAFASFVTADNVKIDMEIGYMDEEFSQTSVGSFNVADEKFYNEGTTTVNQYGIENSFQGKGYLGEVDGTVYSWDWNSWDNEWTCVKETFDYEHTFTAFGALYYVESFIIDSIKYSESLQAWRYESLYSTMTYDETKEAYVLESDGDYMEVKIVDGKIYSIKLQGAMEEAEGYMLNVTESFTFTYGNAVVGALPEVTAGDTGESVTVVIPAPEQTSSAVTED
ncbi:MAG: hypothetical protein IJY21_00560 [Clostridia bacterium]|nr:hypothetical protein [Clostridia bacterium]